MKKQKIFICLILSVLLSGCQSSDVRSVENNISTESTEEIKETQETQETPIHNGVNDAEGINFGFDEVDESTAMDSYVYSGEKIEVPYHIQANKATGHDVGFLVFIDGVCQKYSIKDDSGEKTDDKYMHRFILSDTDDKKFTFLIKPNIGKKGDKKGIYICGIINPSFQPNSKDEPSYQYYGRLFQTIPQQVRFEADAPIEEEHKPIYTSDGNAIPDEIKNAYEAIFGFNIEESGGMQMRVDLFKENNEEAYIEEKNNTGILHLQIYGGKTGKYRTTLFINHEPVLIDGKEYIETNYEAKTMSKCDVNIDCSKISKISTIYAITVPADQNYLEYEDVKKTSSKMLWLENK